MQNIIETKNELRASVGTPSTDFHCANKERDLISIMQDIKIECKKSNDEDGKCVKQSYLELKNKLRYYL